MLKEVRQRGLSFLLFKFSILVDGSHIIVIHNKPRDYFGLSKDGHFVYADDVVILSRNKEGKKQSNKVTKKT